MEAPSGQPGRVHFLDFRVHTDTCTIREDDGDICWPVAEDDVSLLNRMDYGLAEKAVHHKM